MLPLQTCMMAHTCNSHTGEAEAGGSSPVPNYLGLHNEPQASQGSSTVRLLLLYHHPSYFSRALGQFGYWKVPKEAGAINSFYAVILWNQRTNKNNHYPFFFCCCPHLVMAIFFPVWSIINKFFLKPLSVFWLFLKSLSQKVGGTISGPFLQLQCKDQPILWKHPPKSGRLAEKFCHPEAQLNTWDISLLDLPAKDAFHLRNSVHSEGQRCALL